MGVSISGLASGLNWQNIVNELIAAQEVPVTTLQKQQTTNTTQISDLTTLEADINNLQSSADALGADGTFAARSATFADSTTAWSATAAPSTTLGQYTFDVSQVAKAAAIQGVADVGAPISATDDVSGVTVGTMNTRTAVTAGTFSVNGVQISVSATDSLQDVFNNIETQTAAAGDQVTASYDSTTDAVTLQSASGNKIVLGSSNDTSNLLSVLKLYTPDDNSSNGAVTSEGTLGVTNLSAAISSANLKTPVSGGGSFEINGVTISYNSNYSIQNILDTINKSSAGVIASYNQSTDQFSLTNSTTGNTGITINSDPNGILGALGLTTGATFQAGKNCIFSLNGGASQTSTSNTLDSTVTGVAGLSVTVADPTEQTVTVGADNSAAATAINNFITSYNAVQDYITSETTIRTNTDGSITTADLTNNRDVSQIQTDLENMVFNSVPGLTNIQRLDDIGIGFTGTSPDLSILDQSALTDALTNNSTDVNTLFNGTGGLVSQIDSYVENTTGFNGTLPTDISALNANNTDITNQINTLQTQIEASQTQMTDEYVAMETALSSIQTEEASLNAALNTGSSSSSSSSSSTATTSNFSADNVSVS